MIPGTASIVPNGNSFDFSVEAPGKHKTSGPYDTQEEASEAAQKWAEENGIKINLNLVEGARGEQHIE